MMMRATCQDVKTRHGPTTGEERVGKPSKRAGQRARVIFLRDDADIGVYRVYTDDEVKGILSTGPFSVASDSGSELPADVFDGAHADEFAMLEMWPSELRADSDDCNADDSKHAETNAGDKGHPSADSGGSGAFGVDGSGVARRVGLDGVVSEMGRDPERTAPRSYASVVCVGERAHGGALPGFVGGTAAIAPVPARMSSEGIRGECLGLGPTELERVDVQCPLSSVVRPGSEYGRRGMEGSDAAAVERAGPQPRDKNAMGILVVGVGATAGPMDVVLILVICIWVVMVLVLGESVGRSHVCPTWKGWVTSACPVQ